MQAELKSAPSSAPGRDAAEALTAVAESAAAVARAEVRLLVAEGKSWLTRIGLGLLLLWLTLLLLQVFVLLLALAPVLSQDHRLATLALMLSLSLLPTVAVGWLAVRELKRPKDPKNGRESSSQ